MQDIPASLLFLNLFCAVRARSNEDAVETAEDSIVLQCGPDPWQALALSPCPASHTSHSLRWTCRVDAKDLD